MNGNTQTDSKLPVVSVIMPIRNEGTFIEQSLGAVLDQDYPQDLLEVLVVDGMSDDGTRETVRSILEHTDISGQLLDNPHRIVPTAMNIGIQAAKGSIIVRVDGHTIIETDYVRRAVEALRRTGAHNVGGLMRPVPSGYVPRAVAAAMSSPFGVGASIFHYAEREAEADTVYLGVYPKWVLEHVGMYDEEFVRNQDDELNDRVRKAGGRIMLCPELKSAYYPRSTLKKLAKQYFQYGWWKVRCYQKHPKHVGKGHLAPTAFVVALISGLALSTLNRIVGLLWLTMMALYLIGATASAIRLGPKYGWSLVPIMPIVFFTIHVSYGLGMLLGIIRFAKRWRDDACPLSPLPPHTPL
ncbi:MAG TPA: glycosyltransferase family 2 protein [Firmicutes bacterium]|nr:glycosyltransferase family 2 protein [Bacillota bacterium]